LTVLLGKFITLKKVNTSQPIEGLVDTQNWFLLLLVFIVPGLFAVLFGFWILRGNIKRLYFARHIYANSVYMLIPQSIGWFSIGMAAMVRSEALSLIFVYVGGIFLILGLVCAFVEPSFLKPVWLKRLEKQHGDILHILQKEANQIGLKTWEKRIDTEGLEVWVTGVRRKYGWDHPDTGNPYK
jgi:hypothetical protein